MRPPAGLRAWQAERTAGGPRAVELAQQCLRAIAERNAALGAFVEVAAEAALAAARASDARQHEGAARGALDGAPLAVKDNIEVAGLGAAAGLQALRGRRAERDAACVARLREQGAVFLGKTLMDEAAFGALGDNPWFGRCHNPARRGYTAGGSSAGSAAAVAAGLCLGALGSDTLGSVRIPASYCGVVGYVPSRGMIAMDGVLPLAPSFDRVGVLAASVADAADLAAAMAGALAPRAAPGVTVGVVQGLEAFVAAPIRAALERAVRALEDAGCRRVAIDAGGFAWSAVRRGALLHIEIEGASALARWLDDPAGGLSGGLRGALEFGRRADAERVARAARELEEARARVAGWLERAQVLALPATPQCAFAFDGAVPADQADLAAPASILGLPALSVPATVAPHELPVGVQLLAARGADDLLLGVAGALA